MWAYLNPSVSLYTWSVAVCPGFLHSDDQCHQDSHNSRSCSRSVQSAMLEISSDVDLSVYKDLNQLRHISPNRSLYLLHQVCSSVYVTDGFIGYLANTISNSFSLPAILFQSQSAALLQQFIASTTESFLLSLRLIRSTTQANALLSTRYTNYKFLFPEVSNTVAEAVQYTDNCTCASASDCIAQLAFYPDNLPSMRWVIPGIYSGCFVLESLLRSNLQCFCT